PSDHSPRPDRRVNPGHLVPFDVARVCDVGPNCGGTNNMSVQQPIVSATQTEEPAVATIERRTSGTRAADLLELTKPRITLLVLVTTGVGFYMGSSDALNFWLLFHTILGTALVASGASALNQYFERDLDARMVRTRNRPLPDGRLLANDALMFSALISVA